MPLKSYGCSDGDHDALMASVPGLADKDRDDGSAMSHIRKHVEDLSAADTPDDEDKADAGDEKATQNMSMADLRTAAKANRAAWKADHLKNVTETIPALEVENAALKAQVQELSMGGEDPEQPNAISLSLAATGLDAQWDSLIESGSHDRNTVKTLKSIFRNAEGKPTVLALSLTDDTHEPRELALIRTLKGNKPVTDMKFKTGVQELELSRVDVTTGRPADSTDAADKASAAEVAEARKLASLPAK